MESEESSTIKMKFTLQSETLRPPSKKKGKDKSYGTWGHSRTKKSASRILGQIFGSRGAIFFDEDDLLEKKEESEKGKEEEEINSTKIPITEEGDEKKEETDQSSSSPETMPIPSIPTHNLPPTSIPRSRSHHSLEEKETSYFFATVTRARNGIFEFWKKMEKIVERDRSHSSPIINRTKMEGVSNNYSTTQPKTSTHSTKVTVPIQRNWKEETSENWKKPLNKTSVVKDLPRLASFMIIELSNAQKEGLSSSMEYSASILRAKSIDEENYLKEEAQRRASSSVPAETTAEKILNVLLQIASLVENQTYVARVLQLYSENIKSDNDETGALARQLHKVLHEIGEDTKLVRVLKACQQGIIAPVIIEMRMNILKELLFKDAPGWSIRVFESDSSIWVVHSKRQCNQNVSKPEEEFNFEWQLKMKFDLEMSSMQEVIFAVSNLQFGEQTDSQLQEKIRASVDKYLVT